MSEVEVQVGAQVDSETGVETGRQTAVVVDRPGGRAWSGEGATASEAATGAVRSFLRDRRSREYVGQP